MIIDIYIYINISIVYRHVRDIEEGIFMSSKWNIDPKEIDVIESNIIGKGQFGVIYRGRLAGKGKPNCCYPLLYRIEIDIYNLNPNN